ncbi:MAG: EMC3/TMCO1 family protein [Nitrososphaeria archaeon]|jgi:uncharacterized membrane protein (DUF106 family)
MLEPIVLQIVWKDIPNSTLLLVAMSVGLNIISQVATRLLTNVDEMRRVAREAKQFRGELMDAIKKGDKVKEAKLKKKEKSVRDMEMKSSNQRLKASFIFIIPFMLIYYFIASLIGGASVVASSPIQIPFIVTAAGGVQLFWWYLITSFSFSTLITKLAGTSLD